MPSRFRTIMVLTLIVGFAAASIVFAQGQPSPYSGVPGWELRKQSERPDTGLQEETSGMQEDISARVAEVNQQQQTIKLLTENGNTVELQVSEQLLTDLDRGDSVEVSIRKIEWGGVAHAAEPSMAKTTSGDYRVDLDTNARTIYVFTSVKPPAGSDTARTYPPSATLTVTVENPAGNRVAGVPVTFEVAPGSMLQGMVAISPQQAMTAADGTVQVTVTPTSSATMGVGEIIARVGNVSEAVQMTVDKSPVRGLN